MHFVIPDGVINPLSQSLGTVENIPTIHASLVTTAATPLSNIHY